VVVVVVVVGAAAACAFFCVFLWDWERSGRCLRVIPWLFDLTWVMGVTYKGCAEHSSFIQGGGQGHSIGIVELHAACVCCK